MIRWDSGDTLEHPLRTEGLHHHLVPLFPTSLGQKRKVTVERKAWVALPSKDMMGAEVSHRDLQGRVGLVGGSWVARVGVFWALPCFGRPQPQPWEYFLDTQRGCSDELGALGYSLLGQ